MGRISFPVPDLAPNPGTQDVEDGQRGAGVRLGCVAHLGVVADGTCLSDVRQDSSLSARSGERWVGGILPLPGCAGVSDRCAPEPVIVHGFARRLLMFELADEFTLRFTQRVVDIRVLSDCHQGWKAGQPRP